MGTILRLGRNERKKNNPIEKKVEKENEKVPPNWIGRSKRESPPPCFAGGHFDFFGKQKANGGHFFF